MADAAAYDRASGVLRANNLTKCMAMPTLSAAVSATGPFEFSALFCMHLTQRFSSFDDVILHGEEYLPELFEELSDEYSRGDAFSTVYLIGWHDADNRPAAYAMDCWTDDSSHIAQVMENTADVEKARRFKFSEQVFSGTPLPGADLLAGAGFKTPSVPNDLIPEIDLLHVMEIQRHEEIEAHYWVGGKALLTTVDHSGITQRVVHHWQEDRVGETITPRPIEWKAWREERMSAHVAEAVLDGLSRLQRERMAKKARKGTLRSV